MPSPATRIPNPDFGPTAAALSFLPTRQPPLPHRPLYPRCGRVVQEVGELDKIFNVSVSLCILRRPRCAAIAEYLADHSPTQIQERMDCVPADAADFSGVLRDFPSAGRACMEQDLQFMVELFATLTDAARVGIRLAITHQAQCPRFHVDRVGLRLICTWQGLGTEWLEHGDVNRRYLGSGSCGVPDDRSGLLLPSAQIRHMQPFDIGLFKGELWPGNAGRGSVHRSPPVPFMSPHRIMLTLDEM